MGNDGGLTNNPDVTERELPKDQPLTGRRGEALALAGVFLLAVLIVGLHVRAYTTFSPIDELANYDSVVKLSHFDLVKIGEQVSPSVLREQACRGIDRDDRLPPCDAGQVDPTFFYESGLNSASWKLPIYPFVTGIVARILRWAGQLSSFFVAARLVSGFWLGAGAVLCWFAFGELGIERRARAVAIVLLMTTPVVVHVSSIVNPSSVLILGGSAILLAFLRWERQRVRLWVPLAIAGVAVMTDLHNVLAVGALGIYFIIRGASRRTDLGSAAAGGTGPTARAQVLLGACLLVATMIAPEVHSRIVHLVLPFETAVATAPGPEAIEAQHVAAEIQRGPVSTEKIVNQVGALITPVDRPYVPAMLSGIGTSLSIVFLDWILIGCSLGAILVSRRATRLAALAAGAFLILLATGPATALANARSDVFFVPPARYGIAVLPILFALVADSAQRGWVFWLLAGGGGLAAFNLIAHLV